MHESHDSPLFRTGLSIIEDQTFDHSMFVYPKFMGGIVRSSFFRIGVVHM